MTEDLLIQGNPVDKALLFFESQSDMALFCGVHPSTVGRWRENGKIPREEIDALARYTKLRKYEFDQEEFMPWE